MINIRKREIGDVLEEISKIKDKDERKNALRAVAQNGAFAKVLQWTYHPDFVLELPEGEVPESLWTKSNHNEFNVLYNLVTKGKIWHVTTQSKVNKMKKEQLFIEYLEMVAKKDQQIIIAIKDKKLPWKTLDKKFVTDAIPELFPAENKVTA